MLTCEKALERMSEALDAPLPLEKRQELEDHLERCPECRAACEALFRMEDALQSLGETSAPPELISNVMDCIQTEKAQLRRPLPFWKQAKWRSLAGLAACAVLCVGLYYGAGRNSIASDVTAAPSEATVQEGQDTSAPSGQDAPSASLSQSPESEDSSPTGNTQSTQETPKTDASQDTAPEPARSAAPSSSGGASAPSNEASSDPETDTRTLPTQPETSDASSSESSDTSSSESGVPETASNDAQTEPPSSSQEDGAAGETALYADPPSETQIEPQDSAADPAAPNLSTAVLPPWGDITALVLQDLPEDAKALLPAQTDWTQEEDGTRWCTVTPEALETLQTALADAGVDTQLPEPPWTDLCAVVVLPAELSPEGEGDSAQSE